MGPCRVPVTGVAVQQLPTPPGGGYTVLNVFADRSGTRFEETVAYAGASKPQAVFATRLGSTAVTNLGPAGVSDATGWNATNTTAYVTTSVPTFAGNGPVASQLTGGTVTITGIPLAAPTTHGFRETLRSKAPGDTAACDGRPFTAAAIGPTGQIGWVRSGCSAITYAFRTGASAHPDRPLRAPPAPMPNAVGKDAGMRRFALAVMGSGSGNMLIPEHPDGPVAIIEHATFGGTCINRGCIPSKMLLRAADVAYGAAQAGTFGVGVTVNGVDWPAIRDRVFATTDGVSCDGRDHRRHQDGVTFFEGSARFVGPRTLVVGDETLQADQVVIATGSSPVVPPVFADAGVEVHTSDTVMRLAALPVSMIIVGGGYVAVEQAHLFSSLGVEVTIIEAADRLLPSMDTGVADRFTDLAGKRWTLALGTAVAEVRPDHGGVAVTTEDGRAFAAGTLLVATGRRANTGDLDVGAAGIGLTDDCRIEVDRYGRAAEGVWALGDCASPHPLKHVANAEARTIVHNLGHPDDLHPLPHEAVPSAIFSEPQVASVGARRQDLEGVDHVVASTPFGDVAYGWALRDDSGFCTIYANPHTGLLLGAHIIGPDAALLLTPLVQALAHGQRVADLARGQYWIHPALSEVVEQTLLALAVDQTVRSGQVH